MEKEIVEKYIGKKVIVLTKSGFMLRGILDHNNTKMYTDDLYLLYTETEYTCYLDFENIEDIKEC